MYKNRNITTRVRKYLYIIMFSNENRDEENVLHRHRAMINNCLLLNNNTKLKYIIYNIYNIDIFLV